MKQQAGGGTVRGTSLRIKQVAEYERYGVKQKVQRPCHFV